jgi:hypothetical protein
MVVITVPSVRAYISIVELVLSNNKKVFDKGFALVLIDETARLVGGDAGHCAEPSQQQGRDKFISV